MLISRQNMIDVLRTGGSVIFNGLHITSLSQLPTAAEIAIASGSKDVKEQTVSSLEEQLRDVQQQLKELKTAESTKSKDEQPVKVKAEAVPKTSEV